MKAVWVIGCNGLLGSALQRNLRRKNIKLFHPCERFYWHDIARLNQQLKQAVDDFSDFIDSGDKWQIYWAAGIGTMNSTEAELATETQTLSTVLELISTKKNLTSNHGALAFSSSAGALYAGATADIITEATSVAPTTDYAREKLKQEKLITTFADKNTGVTTLLARISTLYGAGQAKGKRQGLLAHIARCIIKNQPVHIYVPFDTIRDYITADDAAHKIVSSIFSLNDKSGTYTKIIASEKPTTIAEIVSVFKRITRRRPSIVSSANRLSELYTKRIQFKSINIPINESTLKTSLIIGISDVMSAERRAFTQSIESKTF